MFINELIVSINIESTLHPYHRIYCRRNPLKLYIISISIINLVQTQLANVYVIIKFMKIYPVSCYT